MESVSCQNFVCCAIPLRNLHDLLEHFEQAHCQANDIVGVDGFEGVTLDQMAAGVGLSAELGLGPGTAPQNNNSDPNARCRRPPPVSVSPCAAPDSHTLHALGFEGKEEWSSRHDRSRSTSPAHLNRLPIPSHSEMPTGSEIEEDTMTRLGKTLRETLGTLRTNPITIDRSRNSSNSRSRSGSLSEPHDDGGSASDRALSDIIASFRSQVRGNRPDHLQSSRYSRHGNRNVDGFLRQIGFAPSELDRTNHKTDRGAIDPALVLENPLSARVEGLQDSFGDDDHVYDDIPLHLQLDPELLSKRQQQQRCIGRLNVNPVAGLTPTGRLPRPRTPVSDKPFKCLVPGCGKAYKQQNGLKYHKKHGHPSQQAILTADAPSKPFICHVSICGKRYKNMNGLRYHYQHTGPHGALGTQLLLLGVHPSQFTPVRKKSSTIKTSKPLLSPLTSPGSCPPSL